MNSIMVITSLCHTQPLTQHLGNKAIVIQFWNINTEVIVSYSVHSSTGGLRMDWEWIGEWIGNNHTQSIPALVDWEWTGNGLGMDWGE